MDQRAERTSKLRIAHELGLPLIRFNKIAVGAYSPIYPVYVIGDNPISREFTLTCDEVLRSVPTGHRSTELNKV